LVQFVRFILTCLLCYFVYSGQSWAKRVCVVLMGIASVLGLMGTLAIFINPLVGFLSFFYFAVYLAVILILLMPQSVRDYFNSQKLSMRKIISIMITLLLISGCNNTKVENGSTSNSKSITPTLPNEEIYSPTIVINTPTQENSNNTNINNANNDATKKLIKDLSEKVAHSINNKDMIKLSDYIHPDKGVRFSQNGRVLIKTNLVFKAEQVNEFLKDSKKYIWGAYSGPGDDIELNPKEYLEEFVFNKDYETAKFGYNEKLSRSGYNEDYQETVYPNSIMTEYYFKGKDPKLEGLDWTSLRFIFELYKDNWYLVGIISNQQTI